jgi:hypothetical protein
MICRSESPSETPDSMHGVDLSTLAKFKPGKLRLQCFDPVVDGIEADVLSVRVDEDAVGQLDRFQFLHSGHGILLAEDG